MLHHILAFKTVLVVLVAHKLTVLTTSPSKVEVAHIPVFIVERKPNLTHLALHWRSFLKVSHLLTGPRWRLFVMPATLKHDFEINDS
jgi:hypothetical protein